MSAHYYNFYFVAEGDKKVKPKMTVSEEVNALSESLFDSLRGKVTFGQ